VVSPLTDLLPLRVLPELRSPQAKLAADLPYARAAALLQELLPNKGGLNAMTTRSRTVAIGTALEAELCEEEEIEHPKTNPDGARHLTVGIDIGRSPDTRTPSFTSPVEGQVLAPHQASMSAYLFDISGDRPRRNSQSLSDLSFCDPLAQYFA
jgi:hypothetical protein